MDFPDLLRLTAQEVPNEATAVGFVARNGILALDLVSLRWVMDWSRGGGPLRKQVFYGRSSEDFGRATELAGGFEGEMGVEHIFAFLFQVRRAVLLIFRQIYGGSYQAAARRLGVDRRTVKAKLLAGSSEGES